MTFRTFSSRFYCVCILFICLNAFIWFIWTKDITDPARGHGDLVRIGYLYDFFSPDILSPELPRHHIPIRDYSGQHIDVLTIGDSFSAGGLYQDYFATHLNLNVLNISTQRGSDFFPVEMVARLINSGYLDQIKPRYLLFESTEKKAVSRLADYFSLTETTTAQQLHDELTARKDSTADRFRAYRFINNGNWKFIINNIQYCFRDTAYNGMVLISRLNKTFFSTRRGDRLAFYKDDLKAAKNTTPHAMAKINDNLNRLADILRHKGITLVFMPAPDKLTMYEPYLVSRRYPKSIFFEELRKLPKRYVFIDTKQILSRELAAGTQDLYYLDDTHWTWKACLAIARDAARSSLFAPVPQAARFN